MVNWFSQVHTSNKLVYKIFFKQIIGFIMTFVVPILMLVILTFMFNGIQSNSAKDASGKIINVPMNETLQTLLPGIILIPTLILGFLGVPFVFSSLKETKILDKIAVTPMKQRTMIISIISTFFIAEIFSALALFTIAQIIFGSQVPYPKTWFIIIPWLLSSIVGISLGLLIGTLSKTSSIAYGVGVGFLLPSMFLSGMLYPSMYGAMSYIAKIIPQNPVTSLFKLSWNFGTMTIHNAPPLFGNMVLFSVLQDTLFSYLYPGLFLSAMLIVNFSTMKYT